MLSNVKTARGVAGGAAARSAHPPLRFVLLAIGLLALLSGLWAGLMRLGISVPDVGRASPLGHGPLMVSGFLGTVISLERAVALGKRWAYAAPLLNALGALALIAGLPASRGALLATAGSAALVLVFAAVIRRQSAPFTWTMALGALAWLAGNALWLAGEPIHRVVPWWMAFLVLTIAGERLELSRLLQHSRRSYWWFGLAIGALVAGLLAGRADAGAGARLLGLGLVLLALWLYRYDVARRTVHGSGLPRYIAVALLAGYAWLALGGVLHIHYGSTIGGPAYDATLHTVFLGFVFTMIFAHAPIIGPAITGFAVPYHAVFYLHLALFHLSLVPRIAGDLAESLEARQVGGVLNEVALTLFLVVTVGAVLLGRRRQRAARG